MTDSADSFAILSGRMATVQAQSKASPHADHLTIEVVIGKKQASGGIILVPRAGLEPACGCPRWILSPLRLPFRHLGTHAADEASFL